MSDKQQNYRKKIKRIELTFNTNEYEILKKRFQNQIVSSDLKSVLLHGEYQKTVINKNDELARLLIELKKIGNNINQLSRISNAQNNVTSANQLEKTLIDLTKTSSLIKQKI